MNVIAEFNAIVFIALERLTNVHGSLVNRRGSVLKLFILCFTFSDEILKLDSRIENLFGILSQKLVFY